MTANTRDLSRGQSALRWPGRALIIVVAAVTFAGCGSSSEVQELPPAARESLARRKVDVQPKQKSPTRGSTR